MSSFRVVSVSAAALLALLSLPLATAQDSAPIDLSSVADAWEDRYNEADVDGVAALYTEDTTVMPPGAAAAEGRDAVRANVQGYLDAGAARADISSLLDYGVMGDTAWGTGAYTFVSEAGDPVAVGKFLIIYRRVGADWLIQRHIWNSDLPPVTASPGE